MAISEYDAFGPWIYEIDGVHGIPPLFAPYCQDDTACRMRFKIPREIERRRATPDMDLYDLVVEARAQEVRILRRTDHTVTETRISYGQIEGIQIFRRFLEGRCTIYADGKQTVLRFNTISMQIMQRFVRLLRQNYTGKQDCLMVPAQGETPPDILFENLLRDMQREGEAFRIGAYQPDSPLTRQKSTLLQRLGDWIRPKSIPSAVHLVGACELMILQKVGVPEKGRSEFGYTYTYLPLRCLRGLQIAPNETYVGVTDFIFHAAGQPLVFSCLAQQEAVTAFYQAAALR